MRVTGETHPVGGRGFNVAYGGGPGGSWTGAQDLLNPGNSGGGKAPDFWCAFEDGEERVIGNAPRNTR